MWTRLQQQVCCNSKEGKDVSKQSLNLCISMKPTCISGSFFFSLGSVTGS